VRKMDQQDGTLPPTDREAKTTQFEFLLGLLGRLFRYNKIQKPIGAKHEGAEMASAMACVLHNNQCATLYGSLLRRSGYWREPQGGIRRCRPRADF
jgi:hypothetical protein